MKLSIHPEIFDRFPGLFVGVVVVTGIDNVGDSEILTEKLRNKEAGIRGEFSLENLSQEPKIQSWRQAYTNFGAKPKKYKSSIESLFRVVLQGQDLRSINKIVDIYNFVSLQHILPIGGDDLDRVDGDMRLCLARGDEFFVPLNSKIAEIVRPGEVIYRDEKEVLCRRWNWRECDKTKMTFHTQNAALVIEGLPPVTHAEVRKATEDLAGLIHKLCGGEIQELCLDVDQQEVILTSLPR